MNEKIESILRTLNMIEVHGAENLSHLLGCIQELEWIQADMNAPKGGDVDE